MDSQRNDSANPKLNEEKARIQRRTVLKAANENPVDNSELAKLDSSLKRHTALIKRIRQSLASENRDQILKDIETLSLEKYIDEIAGATIEGIGRCKTEKDVWGAVEVISTLHRRFPNVYTPKLVASLLSALATPSRASLSGLTPEQREKEDSARVSKQRPVLRVCAELAMVGIIRDGPGRSGGEWIMKLIKEMLSNDPSLSSLPLLTTFLKGFSLPFLGILPPSSAAKQVSAADGQASEAISESPNARDFPALTAQEELIEKETKDRFRKMCDGYYDSVAKKLVMEHYRLQEQDRRNHEAYIRSGEIFEDRQQAYEKMTKAYEKLLSSCQSLSELLQLPMPYLPTAAQKAESILIGTADSNKLSLADTDDVNTPGGKWEDEEERRFFEDIPDLADFVPKSILGIEGNDLEANTEQPDAKPSVTPAQVEEEVRKLQEELERLNMNQEPRINGDIPMSAEDPESDSETPQARTPKAASGPSSPQLAPQGPSQLLTALLTKLPEATNRSLIDQAAIDFAFLNSKAARKRVVKFLGTVPKNRTDLLPYYSRFVATLNKYFSDVGTDLVAILDEEFRYLHRKKNVVKELAEVRMKNITFISNLTKFGVIPTHLILHIFKVCLDDFSGTTIDNLALLLEGCGRFLLRSDETRARFATMLELMRRKQSLQHLDQRQTLLLENAYYQCNPPERAPRQEKLRSPMELFIRHLIYDVLTKRTLDKVLKLLRKLNWDDPDVRHLLHKAFTKPWKIKFGNISLLAILVYDLQRYHMDFTIGVVDQVLEDIRLGLEQNVYSVNQKRVATMKYLGELYIYRLLSSNIVFDTLWSLTTFGHPDGRPLPWQLCALDMPDDFFRVRLVCVMLDTCGMCFDRGTQKKKLDNFLIFFQYYILSKNELPMEVDFMVSDSLEAVRPKLQMAKSLEEAANAVDEMLNAVFQNANANSQEEDSDGEDEERPDNDDNEEHNEEEEDEEAASSSERPPSPDEVVVLANSAKEIFAPSEEADADFAKELAKMMSDTSGDSRKVDKKTALALWESNVLPQGVRKKRDEAEIDDSAGESVNTMNFTIVTKRGNKQQSRQLAVPSTSALAIQTRSAQMQDKVEQQHLKRLVLDYEQREEEEEIKAIEARSRNGAIKIRFAG